MSGVTWVTAFLDAPPESTAASEAFWAAATGQVVSARRGRRDEFATLLPDDGDPFLKLQQTRQSTPGGMHLDLHTDDVDGLSMRAEMLGASASYLDEGYVVCGSPGGMTFCIVGHAGGRRPSPQPWPGGRSLVDQVCIDIPPSRWESEPEFWAGLTGWAEREGSLPEFHVLERPDGMPLRFLLQRLDDEQSVVTAHLDLSSDDVDAEVERHVALGATVVRRHQHWTSLRDPAGRGYCVTSRKPG